MNIFKLLGPKTLASSIVAAAVTGCFAWLVLPVTPRMTILANHHISEAAFSADCRYIASTDGEHTGPHQWTGELSVWDTYEARLLFSIPYSRTYGPDSFGGYTYAFSPNADKLVFFSWGDTKTLSLPTGNEWKPQLKPKFDVNGLTRTGHLVIGMDGNLYVLIHDSVAKTTSVHDAISGREVSSWTDTPDYPQILDGGMNGSILEVSGAVRVLREIPSGKKREQASAREQVNSKIALESYCATPDGRTLVVADGKLRTYADGRETNFNFQADNGPTISPDGRIVGALVYPTRTPGYVGRILGELKIRSHGAGYVFYDLTTSSEVGRLPIVNQAHFSRDGKSVVAFVNADVHIYDWPLRSPWGWIASIAAGSAAFVFGVGQCLRWRMRRKKIVQPTSTT